MRRGEAETRLDELTDQVAELAREGRCRHCEAIPSEEPSEDKLFYLPSPDAGPEELKILGVDHRQRCPLKGTDAEIQRLIDRFGFEVDTVLVEAAPRGFFVSATRKGRRAAGVRGAERTVVQPMIEGKCDVCSREAEWRYPCEDFTTPLGFESRGAWDVCGRCHALVEAGDVGALTTVGAAAEPHGSTVAKLNKRQRKRFFELLSGTYQLFLERRTGPAEGIGGAG